MPEYLTSGIDPRVPIAEPSGMERFFNSWHAASSPYALAYASNLFEERRRNKMRSIAGLGYDQGGIPEQVVDERGSVGKFLQDLGILNAPQPRALEEDERLAARYGQHLAEQERQQSLRTNIEAEQASYLNDMRQFQALNQRYDAVRQMATVDPAAASRMAQEMGLGPMQFTGPTEGELRQQQLELMRSQASNAAAASERSEARADRAARRAERQGLAVARSARQKAKIDLKKFKLTKAQKDPQYLLNAYKTSTQREASIRSQIAKLPDPTAVPPQLTNELNEARMQSQALLDAYRTGAGVQFSPLMSNPGVVDDPSEADWQSHLDAIYGQ